MLVNEKIPQFLATKPFSNFVIVDLTMSKLKSVRVLALHIQTNLFTGKREFTTPRHGDRPWAICHLDHTQLALELVSSKTKALLGRPWVTFLSDAYSRRILAFYLTFDAPSYRSCMMVERPISLWDSEYGCAKFVKLTAELNSDKLMRLRPNRCVFGAPPPIQEQEDPKNMVIK